MILAPAPQWAPMLSVARRLGELREHVLFVGGSVTGLLITDPGAPARRPTKDVDPIVQAATLEGYYDLSSQLMQLGFVPDMTGPICRFVVDEIKVDVMPTEQSVLGLKNAWFGAAIK